MMTEATDARPTILVVEDEEMIRETVVETLELAEFTVYAAADAAQALEVARSVQQVDVLFTDVRLPDAMDGLDLAAKLVQEGRCKVVIYATGYNYDPPRMTSPSIIFRKPYSLASITAAARQMALVAQMSATSPALRASASQQF